MKPQRTRPTTDAAKAKRHRGYTRQPNDLITAREAVLLIDDRVAVLIAHWEAERRTQVWWRRAGRAVRAVLATRQRS